MIVIFFYVLDLSSPPHCVSKGQCVAGSKRLKSFVFSVSYLRKKIRYRKKKISRREYYIFIFAILVTFIRVISGFDVKEDFVFRVL